MTSGRWVWDRELQDLVPADEYYARKAARTSSDLPFPMVISDQIEVKSMVDGKVYDSKSALRRSYRERGYVEVGNEELKPAKPRRESSRDAVGRALNRVGISVDG